MNIGAIILGAVAIASITIIACSAREARQAKEKCDAYLSSVRERSKL